MKEAQLNKRLRIADALNTLLQSREWDEITVADICRQSKVPRATLYRTFYNARQIPIWLFEYLVNVHLQPEEGLWHWRKCNAELCRDMLNWKFIFLKAFNLDGYDSVLEHAQRNAAKYFMRYAPAVLKRDITEVEITVVEYHSHIQACLFSKWIRDGMVLAPEQIADILMEFLPSIMREFITDQ